MGALHVNKIGQVKGRKSSQIVQTRNQQYPGRADNRTEVKNPRIARQGMLPDPVGDYSVNISAVKRVAMQQLPTRDHELTSGQRSEDFKQYEFDPDSRREWMSQNSAAKRQLYREPPTISEDGPYAMGPSINVASRNTDKRLFREPNERRNNSISIGNLNERQDSMVNIKRSIEDVTTSIDDGSKERRVVPVLTDLFNTEESETQLAIVDVKQSKYH